MTVSTDPRPNEGSAAYEDLLDAAAGLFRDTFTKRVIEDFFQRRGIAIAPSETWNSKATMARTTLATLPRNRALEIIAPLATERRRFDLVDTAYRIADVELPKITDITRARVADILGPDLHGKGANVEKLNHFFDLGDFLDPLLRSEPTLRDKIRTHYAGPDSSWSCRRLFEELGAMHCATRTFRMLLATSLDPRVRTEDQQRELAQRLNEALRIDGYETVVAGETSGRSLYEVRPIKRGVSGRVKNLVFASSGPKPVLGFSDAIQNDVAVLEHRESCLVYDLPIGDGLLWSALVTWWMALTSETNEQHARKQLGARLQKSLGSDPERLFFGAYFRVFGPRLAERLPALLPQVYLHYDPEIVRRLSSREALFRQRMDFLLLLPGRQRVVIEIDGKHHYASDSGIADPSRYALLAEADRDLRLRGYEVYRFGALELLERRDDFDAINDLVGGFFERLFDIHKII